MYGFDEETGQFRRLRTQEAFRATEWEQTQSGIILPTPREEERKEEAQKVQWQQNSSGLLLPVAASSRPRQKPTCISLFTGAGGFDLGFHSSGWRIVAACDYDTSCAHTYCYNMGTRPIQMHFITLQDRERFVKNVVKPSQKKTKKTEELQDLVELDEQDRAFFHRHDKGPVAMEDATPHYFLGDVRKLTGTALLEAIGMQVGEPDCMIGGPPCQGFSVAGKRDVMDPRNSLVFEYARLIIEVRPKSMCMENVPGILSMVTPQGIPVVDAFCKILADGNYANYEALKQSLEHNAQSWGIIQDQGAAKAKSRKKGQKDEGEDEGGDETTQMTLF